MRRAAIAFVGLVAVIASCSSYGENKSDTETPSSVDGGGTSGTIVPGGSSDGIVPNDGGSPSGDGDAVVIDGRHVPSIVQVTSDVLMGSTPDEIALTFRQNVAKGNTVLLFIGGWGAKVKSASLGPLLLDPLASSGQFPTQTTLMKLVPEAGDGARIDVLLENGGTATALAVELANADTHTQIATAGSGNVTLEMPAPTPTLLIANVVGSGATPMGPSNAQPLGPSVDNGSGQFMVSASKLVMEQTNAKISWSAGDAFQWQAMLIAFRSAP